MSIAYPFTSVNELTLSTIGKTLDADMTVKGAKYLKIYFVHIFMFCKLSLFGKKYLKKFQLFCMCMCISDCINALLGNNLNTHTSFTFSYFLIHVFNHFLGSKMATINISIIIVMHDILLFPVYVDTRIPILGLGIREKISRKTRISSQGVHPPTFAQ